MVPWGEFQPQIAPEKFNEESFERLQQVCEKAKSNDLKFFMRVSYLWDMYPKVQKPNYERFSEIFSNASTKQSWSNYLSRISSVTKDCASGAFISWEDYWNTIDRIKSATSPENRKYLSDYYGFNKWMKIKYPKCKEKCINFVDNGFYYLPTKDSPDFRFVYEWFDDQITKSLLPILANYFDSASVEVRVDDDPIFEGDKIIDWYSHKSTYVINSSEYVFTYWAPAMGAQNIGEKNSAKEVIDRFSWINNKISAATNNKIIIAQLLFEDNTPSATNNAVIRENEKGQFFKSLAKPLVLETSGYMLWGGKYYHANMIFNPSFAIDLDGWRINEKSKIKFITENKRKFLKIYRGAILEQNILAASNHFKGASKKNFFRLSGEGAAQIELSYAGKSIVIRTSSKYENYNINFPSAIIDSLLKIDVKSGSFKIDSLNLYPFTTIANFKNVYGEAGVRHQNIIELNGNISHTAEALQEISMTEESLANVKGVYGIEGNDEKKIRMGFQHR